MVLAVNIDELSLIRYYICPDISSIYTTFHGLLLVWNFECAQNIQIPASDYWIAYV